MEVICQVHDPAVFILQLIATEGTCSRESGRGLQRLISIISKVASGNKSTVSSSGAWPNTCLDWPASKVHPGDNA